MNRIQRVAFANINPNNAVEIYAPDAGILGDEYIAEKLETKAGWNFASPDEDWMRGYPQELEDFIACIFKGKEPISGLDLAEDTLKVVYAGYLSAEKGERVQIPQVSSPQPPFIEGGRGEGHFLFFPLFPGRGRFVGFLF